MAGIFVLTQKVNDVDKYMNEYAPNVMPILGKYGIEPIAINFEADAIEGTGNSCIIIKADSAETIKKFFADPDYAPWKEVRLSCTEANTGLVFEADI